MEGMCVKFDVIGLDSPCVDLAVNVRCFPKPNGAERIQNLSWQGGGKVASGMVAAARLGLCCGIMGNVGDDKYGTFCLRDFQDHGIDTEQMCVRKNRTTNFDIVISDEGSMGRSFVFYPGNAECMTEEELNIEYISNSSYFYMANLDSVTKKAAQMAKQKGSKIFMDADSYTDELLDAISWIDIFIGSEFVYGLKYSYIYNCTTKSEEFLKGYETFIRTAAVLKSLRTLRIAKIGERPVPFMSVMTNEANLIKRFGITTVPISPVEICNRARKILEEKGKEYIKYEEEFVRKFPDGENYQQICATKLAVQELMEENNCSVAAFECWSAFPTLMGLCPCVVLGEMADNGMPLSCETDINGAITLAILRACNLFEESEFLADLTIRHPQNDNAELLWHCGPFPYSLKKDGVEAKLVDGQERFELKQGDLTVCRFDDVDGEYYLFAGEAKTTTGPETNGTYVWMETDNWKRWEEKLMFGPYIHHLGCVYGHYLPVLREVSRYLGIHFDNAHEQGIYSL